MGSAWRGLSSAISLLQLLIPSPFQDEPCPPHSSHSGVLCPPLPPSFELKSSCENNFFLSSKKSEIREEVLLGLAQLPLSSI